MGWLFLLLVSSVLILLWKIHRETSSMDLPSYEGYQNRGTLDSDDSSLNSNFDQGENTNLANAYYNTPYNHRLLDSPLNTGEDDLFTDPSYCNMPGNIYYHICHDDQSSSDSSLSISNDDIFTDPSYCNIPGNIYYHSCHDDYSSLDSSSWSGSSWD